MTSLPTVTATFLFTDVEGSTRMLQELGDEYAPVLEEHRRVLRDAFRRHGGAATAEARLGHEHLELLREAGRGLEEDRAIELARRALD